MECSTGAVTDAERVTVGFDSWVYCRQNRSLRRTMLFWSILRRRKLLLLLRSGLQGSDVRHIQPL